MITVASNGTAFLWGSTSWRTFQYLRPNELLMWSSIQHWKSRGIKKLDMGGGGEYKRKYGGYEISVPWLRASKYAGLESLRATAAQAVRFHDASRLFKAPGKRRRISSHGLNRACCLTPLLCAHLSLNCSIGNLSMEIAPIPGTARP